VAAPKRSKTEREEALAETARLDRRGYSQRQIARVLGVDHSQVCYDLKVIRRRYQDTQLGERAALVAEKVEQYRELRAEAWAAWERSKEDATKRVEENTEKPGFGEDGDPLPGRRKVTETAERRLPGAEYARVILETCEAERKLLGLDAPVKAEVSGPEGGPLRFSLEEAVEARRELEAWERERLAGRGEAGAGAQGAGRERGRAADSGGRPGRAAGH
jgi:predicted transcriptional regulator